LLQQQQQQHADLVRVMAQQQQQQQKLLEALIAKPISPPTTTTTDAALTKHLLEKEARRLQPWRLPMEVAAQLRKDQLTETWESMRTRFENEAKNGNVTAEDMILVTYLAYTNTDDDRRLYFANVLRHAQGPERIRAHNWYTATKAGESFLVAHGATVDRLHLPLFPQTSASGATIVQFAALNLTMLREAEVEGGGEAFSAAPRVFRPLTTRRVPLVTGADVEVLGGEYLVGVGHDGRVDLSEVQASFAALAERVAALERRPKPSPTPRPRNNNTNNNGNYNPSSNYNFNHNRRGGYGGGGRGRNNGPNGAGDDMQAALPPQAMQIAPPPPTSQRPPTATYPPINQAPRFQ
jgi:hypothetical protein